MALSPRSLFKSPMVLLAATISVGLAAAGLFAFFAFNTSCTKTKRVVRVVQEIDACQQQMNDIEETNWSEMEHAKLAECYSERQDWMKGAQAADRGIQFYPNSEVLFNIKAYNQIQARNYDAAVDTLREGLRRMKPASSVMENNLAWAGLWAPREVSTAHARVLYQRALAKSPNSCETLHTGLWVEYALAIEGNGGIRDGAVAQYHRLRQRYNGCEKRLDNNQRDTVHEVLGTGVLDLEMARLSPRMNNKQPQWASKHNGWKLIKGALNRAAASNAGTTTEMCEMATPVDQAHHACVRAVKRLTKCKSKR